MMNDPWIDWKGLKALGWPYSRAHTWRMIDGGYEDAYGKWHAIEPPFPQCVKVGSGKFARCLWERRKLEEYFKLTGLITID